MSTPNARRVERLAALVALLTAMFALPATARAANTFSGGIDQAGTVWLNDHTAVLVHVATAADSTLPAGPYKVKIRLSLTNAPSGGSNRGWTWNPFTDVWAQERGTIVNGTNDAWVNCPTITVNAQHAITSDESWFYAKFGDETMSGPYHVLVSLSGGQSNTFNGSQTVTVTALAAPEAGSWVHNGVATGTAADSLVTAVNETSTTVLAMQRTEPQGVDDNADGVVDNEDYGPTGTTGDFRLGVPANSIVHVKIGNAMWPDTAGFTSGDPDTDIALGATDQAPPTSPRLPSAVPGDTAVTVNWLAAADSAGVNSYRIYRWTAAPTGAAWSPVHALLAIVPSTQLSYTDRSVVDGTPYFYEVRAVDAATNVGPRSTTVMATPNAPVPTMQLDPTAPDGANDWYVTTPTITLAPSASGLTIQYGLETTPSVWTTYTVPFTVAPGVTHIAFRETDGVTTSAVQHADVRFDPTAPTPSVSAPTWSVSSSSNKTFKVSWAGRDGISGASSYEVDYRVNSGSWHATPWRPSTMATSTTFSGSSGSTYYFRVRATDAAGNVSTYAYSVGTTIPYDQTSASFSSGWHTVSRSSDFLGSYKYTTTRNKYASFKLGRGTLYLVANTGPKLGKLAVYFRGKKVATIDTYSKTSKVRQVFKLVKFSGSSASSVKIVNLATYHRPRIELDGFAVR